MDKLPKILNQKELLEELLKLFSSVPHMADPIVVILKAHLLFEDFLYRYIESKVPKPQKLKHAKLRFGQLLYLAQALCDSGIDDHTWACLAKLNSVRNTLAHNIESEKCEEALNAFVEFVLSDKSMMSAERLVESGFSRHFASIFTLHTCLSHGLLMKIERPTLLSLLFEKYENSMPTD